MPVNHKRVLWLMQEDNLLCLRKRCFVATTDCEHTLPVYPNLGAGYDNAQCESFIKTLKYEDLYDARVQIGEVLERIYNKNWLYSTLGCRPPVEYEDMVLQSSTAP